MALILTYGSWRDFRASPLFILVGHVLYTLPFMLRSVMAVMAATDVRTLEESAASLGASPWQRFMQVIVPNARGGIVAGALMVVTLSLGEFNLTWMLHTPLTKTLPVGLADSYASMRLEVASAYTLVFFIMIVPLLVAIQMLGALGELTPARSGIKTRDLRLKTAETGVAIALRDCAKTFPDATRAVGPIDLDVAAGETLVLLGPSGCGKTTLLRIIAGLESPDSGGRVLFDGADVTALPIERRNIGMVFQSYALFPNMNVIDNVAYGLRVRGIGRLERRRQAGDVLAMMRIDELAVRRIDQLSGGQRQRVALARALAVRPRALLLDEPLTALDALLRDTLRSEIDALLRSLKITAVYVTHDQAGSAGTCGSHRRHAAGRHRPDGHAA